MKLQEAIWVNFLADLEPANFHVNIMTLTKKVKKEKKNVKNA